MPLGYDPDFLGVAVELPETDVRPDDLATLDYTHFTVVLDRERRLARLTAVNIDGALLRDVSRGDDWFLDDRVAAIEQAGPDVYSSNDFDRGHLVRRRDPVWGPDAERANRDTFSYANAAPQVNTFNQSKDLWLGLEDYLLGTAAASEGRLTVMTAPVFDEADREYRGVRIPQLFWKIAVWLADGELASTAYLLDQSDLIDDVIRRGADDGAEPGAFRTFQVAVAQIAELTGFELSALESVDRFARRGIADSSGELPAPLELAAFDDILLR
ncbi:DNA/RNA non-specific endonuclease [Marisediminicola sp. LYQ134]|uniref:DNA/RNA non-specific endonuclease n=1 Tax=Marisediminicola sp. LYQ134 TaxID=3391061 RepID=UPI0039832A85